MSEERAERPPADAAPGSAADQEAPVTPVSDADAWATACAEDLAEEKARRRAQYGSPPGSAADELLRLVDTVAGKLSGLGAPLLGPVAGTAAQQVVRQVVQQARSVVEPVIERNPDVFDHLAGAGQELLAAYRSAVQAQEQRWTARADDLGVPGDRAGRGEDDEDPPAGPNQRIDLD
ncbi:DUF5304 domain-containing protein [Streptomyces sp. NPDC093252]|uniref:DUF5304 domain-containing protein n=1 Tax=Streptomyces sp. NPDC093252 TaxID=3154980 RepID=UPI003444D969